MSNNESTAVQLRATDEIHSLFSEIYTAWADNDADAFVARYREDATVVMPGAYHRDREEIRGSMASGFGGPLKGSRAVDETLSIRLIGDAAIVVSKAGILMEGEAEVPTEREVIATWALVREDGRWLVASYANAPAH
jgi:uncharacterized protein (TIGR02246 family)